MTKLEEIARAFSKRNFLNGGDESDDGWSECPPYLKAEYLAQARAAVEAIREPSEAMCLAAGSQPEIAQITWPAMIDAILNEKPD